MSRLLKILGSVVLFLILVSTLTFTFGFLLIGAVVASLWGIYRHYVTKKTLRNRKTWPKSNGYSTGEIIDMPVEEKKNET